ncbi:hypothetical protein LZC95_35075 [Pendulispora brunnea]|uniref:Uncharacterized protein n=1 Tax=Pendulispora brunnea TaxID=2905690 RepID=A0ABZ2JZ65_9BACT
MTPIEVLNESHVLWHKFQAIRSTKECFHCRRRVDAEALDGCSKADAAGTSHSVKDNPFNFCYYRFKACIARWQSEELTGRDTMNLRLHWCHTTHLAHERAPSLAI